MTIDTTPTESMQPQGTSRRPASPRSMLEGQSPKERAAEKLQDALGWLGLFHYSSEALIKDVLGIKGGGFMKKLELKRLVKPVPVYSISSQRVWVLTAAGLVDASIATGRDLQYPHNPERVAGNFLKHNLLVQQCVAASLPTISRKVRGILPARMLSSGTWGEAIPDVLFSHQSDDDGFTRTALEIELTYKKPAELDRKFVALQAMLAEDPEMRVRWLFPTQPMALHYERIWGSLDACGTFQNAVTFAFDSRLTKAL